MPSSLLKHKAKILASKGIPWKWMYDYLVFFCHHTGSIKMNKIFQRL